MGKSWGLLLLVVGCASVRPVVADSARAELLAADRAFSQASRDKGAAAAFAEYLAPEAVELSGSAPPARSRDAIVAGLQVKPGKAFVLVWEPDAAEAAASGELGYTWGHYTMTHPDRPDAVEQGKYLTVWRRDPASHRWLATVDIGS